MNKHFKIIIRGGYGLGNFGDDALMIQIYKKLIENGFTNNDIAFNCYYSEYLDVLIPGLNFIDIHDKNFSCQYLIYGGGTQFYSFEKRKIDISRIFKIIVKKVSPFLKKNEWNKSYAFGIGLGPFHDKFKLKEIDTKQLFKKMDRIWTRDPKSLELCEKWRLNNVNNGTDICNVREINAKSNIDLSSNRIGLVLRDWKDKEMGDLYYKAVKDLISNLLERNFNLKLIIFSNCKDEYWKSYFVDRGLDFKIWNPQIKGSYEMFISFLSSFDLIITSRYHGAIYASILNVPFITIGIEQKLEMISDLYSQGSFCWEKPFYMKSVINYTNDILKNRLKYIDNIKKVRKKEKEKADRMFNELISELK